MRAIWAGMVVGVMIVSPVMICAQNHGSVPHGNLPEGAESAPLMPPVTIHPAAPPEEPVPVNRLHPPVQLLDNSGRPVVESGDALSLMRSCGECHDTAFILRHNYHAAAGMDELTGPPASGRAWDEGPGLFGRWNPMTYRMLTGDSGAYFDMGTADWIRTMGPRHVGGGPSETSRFSGLPLTEVSGTGEIHPDTHVLDPVTGKPVPWDWSRSGTMELNCLMCHIPAPNNSARIDAIRSGRFKWASTATLVGSGAVVPNGDGYGWNREAFDAYGHILQEYLPVGDPASGNCRQCHGKACRCEDPVVFLNSVDNWSTETTGEVFSPEQMYRSGMNLSNKTELFQPWDLHAQRLVECTSCHYSLNNPKYNENARGSQRPDHLRFDARKLSFSDYLRRPDHHFAKGVTSQGTVARRLDGTMRDCRDCHDAGITHNWLPYKQLHFDTLSCQACHIPRIHAPARMLTDWTVLTAQGEPRVVHRGVDGPINRPETLIQGYRPILLMQEENGVSRLKPHNLITSYFWVQGQPGSPVRVSDLNAAFFSAPGIYHADVTAVLDTNGDGTVSTAELRLDTPEKVAAIQARLEAVGMIKPRIAGEIQPYSLSHGVATGKYAMRDCGECHSYGSRINAEIDLADIAPAGVIPEPVQDGLALFTGSVYIDTNHRLKYHSSIDPSHIYIHGTDRLQWMDYLGILVVAGVILGGGIHGGLRFLLYRRRKR